MRRSRWGPLAVALLSLSILSGTAGSARAGNASSAGPVRPNEDVGSPGLAPGGSSVAAGSSRSLRLAQAGATPERSGTPVPGALGRKGGLAPESDEPLSIKADELEAVEEAGQRRLRFTRSVHVQQGELAVHSDRLEAFYPKDAEQPDRLVASGHVRVQRLDRQLACDSATYYRPEERLVCKGHAELREGEDRVRGDQIEIFFEQNRVRVSGGAVVNVTPERRRKEGAPEPVSAGPAAGGAGDAR